MGRGADEGGELDGDAGGSGGGGAGRQVWLVSAGDGVVPGGAGALRCGGRAGGLGDGGEPVVRADGEDPGGKGAQGGLHGALRYREASRLPGGVDLGFLGAHAAGVGIRLHRGGIVWCADLVEDVP